MIIDLLSNIRLYRELIPGLDRVENFLNSCGGNTPAPGRSSIGEDHDVIVSSAMTGQSDREQLEVHLKYLDVHVLFSGKEMIRYAPSADLELAIEYCPETDAAMYRAPGLCSELHLEPGLFVVFFPEDAHMAGFPAGKPSNIEKAVFKLLRK